MLIYIIQIGVGIIWGMITCEICLSFYYSYPFTKKTHWVRFMEEILFLNSDTSKVRVGVRLVILFIVLAILFSMFSSIIIHKLI